MEKKNQKNSLAQIDITWSKHFLPSAEGPGFFLHQLISIYLYFFSTCRFLCLWIEPDTSRGCQDPQVHHPDLWQLS